MIQVLQRAFAAMEHLSRSACTLKQLSDRTGIAKSTLCNILRSLEQLGAVAGDGQRGYRIGPRLAQLAGGMDPDALLRTCTGPVLEQLSSALGETCTLAVLRDDQRRILLLAAGDQELTTRPQLDKAENLWQLATGRVLVGHLTAQQRKELVGRIDLPGAAWADIDSIQALEDRCARVRAAKVLIVGDYTPHVVFCAAPVLGQGGRIEAAISCSVPKARWRDRHRRLCLESLEAAARRATQALQRNTEPAKETDDVPRPA